MPILSTIPRSGTWFLRYAVSFLSHLGRGGRIDDRITGKVVGDPLGAPFDFRNFRGGPLFLVHGTMPSDRLFIGHTACPGFANVANRFAWWPDTDFHVPGYDYLHEGLNYKYTPTDLSADPYTAVSVAALERAAWKGRSEPMALVYRNPVDQAASYFPYCQNHANPAYNTLRGRPLAEVPFRDYLFGSALPSYAKQFISFQAMATRWPGLVRLVAYEHLMEKPEQILANLLNHLSGSPRDWPMLRDAVHLARREHLRLIEAELGRSLDGTRVGRGSHMRQGGRGRRDEWLDAATFDEAIETLRSLGINTDLFEWPPADDIRISA